MQENSHTHTLEQTLHEIKSLCMYDVRSCSAVVVLTSYHLKKTKSKFDVLINNDALFLDQQAYPDLATLIYV
jgi:hypothetical protein